MPRKKPVENAGTAAAARRRSRGDSSGYTVTSASGSPGPAGVLTTGHYSPNGQRMYGGYASTGRGRAGSTLRPGIGSSRHIPGIGFPGVPGRRGGRAGENGSGLSGNWRRPRLPGAR